MTVRELIERLQKYPPDLRVRSSSRDGWVSSLEVEDFYGENVVYILAERD
jgi:hypothetical protein